MKNNAQEKIEVPQTIAQKMEEQINKKEKYMTNLHIKLNKVTDLKIKEANERARLMSSNLSDKIEGKVTEKAKVAYCDKKLEGTVNTITWLENDITKIKKQMELCDNKISLYKYTIRELEL